MQYGASIGKLIYSEDNRYKYKDVLLSLFYLKYGFKYFTLASEIQHTNDNQSLLTLDSIIPTKYGMIEGRYFISSYEGVGSNSYDNSYNHKLNNITLNATYNKTNDDFNLIGLNPNYATKSSSFSIGAYYSNDLLGDINYNYSKSINDKVLQKHSLKYTRKLSSSLQMKIGFTHSINSEIEKADNVVTFGLTYTPDIFKIKASVNHDFKENSSDVNISGSYEDNSLALSLNKDDNSRSSLISYSKDAEYFNLDISNTISSNTNEFGSTESKTSTLSFQTALAYNEDRIIINKSINGSLLYYDNKEDEKVSLPNNKDSLSIPNYAKKKILLNPKDLPLDKILSESNICIDTGYKKIYTFTPLVEKVKLLKIYLKDKKGNPLGMQEIIIRNKTTNEETEGFINKKGRCVLRIKQNEELVIKTTNEIYDLKIEDKYFNKEFKTITLMPI